MKKTTTFKTTKTAKTTTKVQKEENAMTKTTAKTATEEKKPAAKAKKEKKDLQSLLPKLADGMTVSVNSKGHVIVKDSKFRVLGLDQKCMVITHEDLTKGLNTVRKPYGWRIELPTTADITTVLTNYAEFKKAAAEAKAKKEAEKKAAAEAKKAEAKPAKKAAKATKKTSKKAAEKVAK